MEYPYTMITATSSRDVDPAYVSVHIQAEYIPIDVNALTQAIQQWLLDNVAEIVSTTAERRDIVYPVTQLPPLAK